MNPDGGPAIPVSVNTDRAIQGGTAIPVYGYASAPADGRPAQAGAALPVRVLTAADLVQNGGTWVLEGRTAAMPVFTAPASSGVLGGPAIAVYPINAWPPSSAPTWAPTDIAGLAVWRKADVGRYKDAAKAQPATADDDVIYTWADQSGNGNDATQSAAGNRPVLKLNIQNGLPVVRFDGTDNYMTGAIPAGAAKTWFLVIKKRSAPAGVLDSLNSSPSGNELLVTGNAFSATAWLAYPNEASAVQVLGGTANAWQIITLKFASAASCTPYFNGTAGTPFDPANGYATDTTEYLGASATAPGTQASDIDIAEEILYTSALSDADRGNVETYLNSRWGVY